MINLRELINFLPVLFKDTDTYKDNQGKGILERFLEIAGDYLEDYVTPEIDRMVDNIDIEHTPSIYLNYLWEFLGEIPFAYSKNINPQTLDLYRNQIYSSEDLEKYSKQWEIDKTGPIVLSDRKVRDVLKYAITLLKIRGTKKFFETLLKLYGIQCTIEDPTDSETNPWFEYIPRFDEDPKFDLPRVKFDSIYTCLPCSRIKVDISTVAGFMDINSEYFRDSAAIIFSGKLDGLINTFEGIEAYNQQSISMASSQEDYQRENLPLIYSNKLPASLNDFIGFRRLIEKFFDKYLPFNVNADITYQGVEVDDHISIKATFIDPITNKPIESKPTSKGQSFYELNKPDINRVGVKVEILSTWPDIDRRFHVEMVGNVLKGVTEFPKYSTNNLYYISRPGFYKFISVANPSKAILLLVLEKYHSRSYSIGLMEEPPIGGFKLSPTNISIDLKIQSSSIYRGVTTECRVRLRNTGESKKSQELWSINQPGRYVFEIVEFPVKYLVVDITKEPSVYTVTCEPNEGTIQDIEGVSYTETILRVEDNYGTTGLTLTCLNDGLVYKNNTKLKIYNAGVYSFKCTQDKSKNPVIATFIAKTLSEAKYELSLWPSKSTLYKNPDTQVKTNIRCYSTNGFGDDFRVRLVETGEIFNAGGEGYDFRTNKPGKYTFEAMGDLKIKRIYSVYPYYVTHPEGLFIRPIDATDPNWVTKWEPETENKNATYRLGSVGTVCKVQMLLYLEGRLVMDPSYKVVLNSDSTIEYPLNTELNLNKPGNYTFYVNQLSNLRARLTLIDQKDNIQISCSPTGVTIHKPTDEVRTVVTCTNQGGQGTTDIKLRGKDITYKSPYTFITKGVGIRIFESVADPSKTCTFTVIGQFNPGPDINPDPVIPPIDPIE